MTMKKNIVSEISLGLLVSVFFFSSSSSAHFFPNTSSLPRTLTNKTIIAWEGFSKLRGCHRGQNVVGLSRLKQYFQHFGYLNNNPSILNFTDHFDDEFESALKTYQLNFNLNTSGELDTATLSQILLPRCGNADFVNGSTTMNSGFVGGGGAGHLHTVGHYSFFTGRPRWRKSQLTYAFLPENQLSGEIRGVFARAFQRWSEVVPLTFSEAASFEEADITIGFFSGDHGDGEPFDGVMGTLAHAFSPPSGRFHLDLDENWLLEVGDYVNGSPSETGSGVHLESVAVHEIGHLLGLGHSSVRESIMYPTISSNVRKVELHEDDIMGVQTLYGSNPNYNGTSSLLERDTSGARGAVSGDFSRHIALLFVVGFVLHTVL